MAVSATAYGELLAKTLPKVIETDEEFRHFVSVMEDLDRRHASLTDEERALLALLERLTQDYDDRVELPDVPPNEMLEYLMNARGLKQADLVSVIGTRAQVSDIVTGRRGISKQQAKKLAEFFRVSVDVFI
jgi:HTH-type transcriptional regulator / antitoxin HigA